MDARRHVLIQRRGWDRAADHYDRSWRRQLLPAQRLLLATAKPRPGDHLLDVACGTGALTVDAAAAVLPGGRVVATDLSPRIVAATEARVAGLDHVETACCDAQQLVVEGPFDVAMCSLGLMYVPDPPTAAAELRRVLRPGGRVVVSVWGDRRHCGWASVFGIVAARVTTDVCPHFFALGAPGILAAVLRDAGFVDARELRLGVTLDYRDGDDSARCRVPRRSGGPRPQPLRRRHPRRGRGRVPGLDRGLPRRRRRLRGARRVRRRHRHRPASTPRSAPDDHRPGQPPDPPRPPRPARAPRRGAHHDHHRPARRQRRRHRRPARRPGGPRRQPAAAEFTWQATCSWVHGTHSTSTVDAFSGLGQDMRHRTAYRFEVDHPECFASQDLGATPVEYVLVGLAGCLTAGVAAVAQHRGVQLRSVTATITGRMNVLGILGADPDVRNGFDAVDVRFAIDADASRADLEAIIAQSQKRSAVFDVVTNPTDVVVALA